MKKYSSNRAQKGKTAYRTPSLFKANKAVRAANVKAKTKKENFCDKNFNYPHNFK